MAERSRHRSVFWLFFFYLNLPQVPIPQFFSWFRFPFERCSRTPDVLLLLSLGLFFSAFPLADRRLPPWSRIFLALALFFFLFFGRDSGHHVFLSFFNAQLGAFRFSTAFPPQLKFRLVYGQACRRSAFLLYFPLLARGPPPYFFFGPFHTQVFLPFSPFLICLDCFFDASFGSGYFPLCRSRT